VVVVGGGSIGNFTLYHLGKQGAKAVLLEKVNSLQVSGVYSQG